MRGSTFKMGQTDIYELLKEFEGKYFDHLKISEILKLSRSAVIHNISNLIKRDDRIKVKYGRSINGGHPKRLICFKFDKA